MHPSALHLNPRRRPYLVGDNLVSFAALQKCYRWPRQASVEAFRTWLNGGEGGPPQDLLDLLEQQGILQESEPEQLFALCEVAPGHWANSRSGATLLKKTSRSHLVLDALSWDDIDILPKQGAFLYLGDREGGFYAPAAGTGSVPCPRCLLLRYLSGRRASFELYSALRSGERVAFETELLSTIPECPEDKVMVYGRQPKLVDRAIPLPDCQGCLQRSEPGNLVPGVFSPVRRRTRVVKRHFANLGELVWLTGYRTVGGGSAWDEDLCRGENRATNEALERYCAHFVPPGTCREGVRFVSDSGIKHFPRRRALLLDPGAVSTGLACRGDFDEAIADGLREVCERHALAYFWLRADRGEPAARRLSAVKSGPLELELYHLESLLLPTVLAIGRTEQGQIVTGSACGELETAKDKALKECLQNWEVLQKSAIPSRESPETFEEHAAFYWNWPELFPESQAWEPGPNSVLQLTEPVWHCDLTQADVALHGRHAVRVHLPSTLYPPMNHRHWNLVIEEAGVQENPPLRPHPFA